MNRKTPELSDRDWIFLDALIQGKSNAQIADEMSLSRQSVKNYLSRLYKTLGVHSRTEAAMWALQQPKQRSEGLPFAPQRGGSDVEESGSTETVESTPKSAMTPVRTSDASEFIHKRGNPVLRSRKALTSLLGAVVIISALTAGVFWATTVTYGRSTVSFPVSTGKVDSVEAFLRARFGDQVEHWVEYVEVEYADGALRAEPQAYFTFPTPLFPFVSGQLTDIVMERSGSGPYRLAFWKRLLHISPPPAHEIALGLADLPAGSRVMTEGYASIGSGSHPLHVRDLPGSPGLERMQTTPALYSYREIYQFSAFVSDPPVAVGNFVYTFAGREDARIALNLFEAKILEGDARYLGSHATGAEIDGELYHLVGSENDHIYWFMGTTGTHLYMAMANGLEDEPTKAALFDALQILPE